jgi:hypothetical protein
MNVMIRGMAIGLGFMGLTVPVVFFQGYLEDGYGFELALAIVSGLFCAMLLLVGFWPHILDDEGK